MKGFNGARRSLPWPQRSNVRRLAVLASLVAGIALTIAPLPAQEEAGRLPFSAYYEGRIDSHGHSESDASMGSPQGAGFGHATFLPFSTAYFSHLVDDMAPEEVAHGTFELVGTGFNVLSAEYQSQATHPDELGYSYISGSYDVTGGYGRFAEARGHGTIRGVMHMPTGTFVMALEGDISEPPAP